MDHPPLTDDEAIRTVSARLPADPGQSFDAGGISNVLRTLPRDRDGGDGSPPEAEGAAPAEPQWSAAVGARSATPALPAPVAPSPYRLGALRGRGGFGEVWEAVQVSLGRVVAIKSLRRDLRQNLPAEEVAQLQREFRLEAAATARLDHPNIVPIYDLGEDESGSPLLAMKLVAGRSWEALLAADFPRLPPTEFLGRHLPILLDMAQAVAFAHARGIVHRDLKPAQVMIGEFGEVLLMDWGLALLWDEARLGDARDHALLAALPTPATATNPAGTPMLMAPEQVRMDAQQIGPWTDVYLLGSTLFHLLTGTYPHNAGSSLECMKRALIGLVETPEERAPGREIPAELSAICMRALEREPERRQHGVRAFIAEVEAYLTGATRCRQSTEIVDAAEARAADAGADYRVHTELLADLARARDLWPANPRLAPLRARVLASYAAAALANDDRVLASLQAEQLPEGEERQRLQARIAAADADAARAARQRRVAIAAAFVLLLVVVAGSAIFSLQLGRARDRAVAARDAADASATEARQARGRAENLLRFLLGDLRTRLEPINRIDLLDDTARVAYAYFEAEIAGAPAPDRAPQVVAGLKLAADLFWQQGNVAQAVEATSRTLVLLDALAAREPDNVAWQIERERFSAYQALYLSLGGRPEEADTIARAALARMERRAAAEPREPGWQRLRAAFALRLGNMAIDRGDLDEALARLDVGRTALDQAAQLEDAPDTETLRMIAVTHNRVGAVQFNRSRYADALAQFEAGRPLFEQLRAINPGASLSHTDLAASLSWLAITQRALGDLGASRDHYVALRDIYRQLCDEDPSNRVHREGLGHVLKDMAITLNAMGRTDEALEALREGQRVLDVFMGDRWMPELAQIKAQVAFLHSRRGDPDAALAEYSGARELLLLVAGRDDVTPEVLNQLANFNSSIGLLRSEMGDLRGGAGYMIESVRLMERIVEENPQALGYRRTLAIAYRGVGLMLQNDFREPEFAIPYFRKGLDMVRAAFADLPESNTSRYELVLARASYATALREGGRHEEAIAEYRPCLETMERLVAEDARNAGWMRQLLSTRLGIVRTLVAMNSHDEADEQVDTAEEILRGMREAAPADMTARQYALRFRAARVAALVARGETERGRLLALETLDLLDAPMEGEGELAPAALAGDLALMRASLAMAQSAGGDLEGAIESLTRAIDGGYKDVATVRSAAAFEPLRAHDAERFRALLDRITPRESARSLGLTLED